MKNTLLLLLFFCSISIYAQSDKARLVIKAKATEIEKKVIAWRRDIHEHPELGNREFRTAELIAKHLQSLGIEVKTGVGKTGVVGLLKGGCLPSASTSERLRQIGFVFYQVCR